MKKCMTVIPVGDVERSLRFWVRGLGLTMADEITEEGKITGCMVSNEYVRFWINVRSGSSVKLDDYEGIRLYWTPNDLHATRERLLELGYMVSGVFVRDHGHTEFFLTDEDGYFHCFGVVTEEMENPK
jgi:hypothetical protein